MSIKTYFNTLTETDRIEQVKKFNSFYSKSFVILAGYAPKNPKHMNYILSNLLEKINPKGISKDGYKPSVEAMKNMLESPNNEVLREEVKAMIKEGLIIHKEYEPKTKYTIKNVSDLLHALNYIIQKAPEYLPEVSHSAFPMSGLFVYMMYSESGTKVFRNKTFNNRLREVLKE